MDAASAPEDAQPAPPSGPPAGAPPRLFTVAEANRLLPYLRAALGDARGHLADLRRCREEMLGLEAVGAAADGTLILAADHRAAARRGAQARERLERVLADIAERGCQVKDLATGLCDFPAEVEGQAVLLCWRIDEEAVTFLHGPTDGFRGRRPIPPGTP